MALSTPSVWSLCDACVLAVTPPPFCAATGPVSVALGNEALLFSLFHIRVLVAPSVAALSDAPPSWRERHDAQLRLQRQRRTRSAPTRVQSQALSVLLSRKTQAQQHKSSK